MPSDTELRETRQRAILAILRRSRVTSQEELVARLRDRGIEATQSSVSRDLRALGIVKVNGRYAAPSLREVPAQSLETIARFVRAVRPAGPHLTVVLTAVGAAQTVALAIDRAGWPEVVGTVAGDDTLFAATASGHDQRRLLLRLEQILKESRHA